MALFAARWGSVLLGVVRLVFGASLVLSPTGNVVAKIFGLSEVVMCAFSFVNAKHAEIDATLEGWLVPACYMIGFVVRPVAGESDVLLDCFLVFLAATRLYALVDLGIGYSVGPASFVGVADGGLYSVVRHPMQLIGLVMRAMFVVANPGWVNVCGFIAMASACYVVIAGEERFCSQFESYRSYMSRVRWRLFPGVW